MKRSLVVLVLALVFSLPSLADQYGGDDTRSCTNATGRWLTVKQGLHWWFCTPDGHVYFWQSIGLMNDTEHSGSDPTTGVSYDLATKLTAKYGDLTTNWANAQTLRAKSWGFNGIGQMSAASVLPTNSLQTTKMPFINSVSYSMYASVNLYGYGTAPIKDLTWGTNPSTGITWRAANGDFFDPSYAPYITAYMTNDTFGFQQYKNSPWVIGLFVDDTDFFFGMGAGPEVNTGYATYHLGYQTLVTSPMQTFTANPGNYGPTKLNYTDSKVYSKTAMTSPPATCSNATPCSLRDFLAKKYGTIGALNTAWGSNYTTFDSAGTRYTGETIGTGDGTNKVFPATLAHTAISPLSVAIKVAGTVQGGDCPWWNAGCQIVITNMATLGGATGTTILSPPQPWLAGLIPVVQSGAPAAAYYPITVYHYAVAQSGYTISRDNAGDNMAAGYVPAVTSPAWDSSTQTFTASHDTTATGYDVYLSCTMTTSATPIYGCSPNGSSQPAVTLQASNVAFTTNWTVPTSGLVVGTAPPSIASSLNYSNGHISISFSTAPANGAAVTVDYTANGWGIGSGLMDEDGRNTTWTGTNPTCLTAMTGCAGNANAAVAANLNEWLGQFASEYFNSVRTAVKTNDSGMLYLGPDTLGTWGTPPRPQILQAANPYLDAAFFNWDPDLPNSTIGAAAYQFYTQYFGDKPMLNFLTMHATADSFLSAYANGYSAANGITRDATQAARGTRYKNYLNTMLTTPSYNGTYQWVGANWWGLYDFWNEKIDWGLVSLNDNAYDGHEAVTATNVTCSAPLNSITICGGEAANYGDVITQVKVGNGLWLSGGSGPAYYTLSTATAGGGSGSISGCAGSYALGDPFSCTVSANSGSTLASVSGCGGSGTTTFSGTMPENDCIVTATFNLTSAVVSPISGAKIQGAKF
jgi:hypothetical protein